MSRVLERISDQISKSRYGYAVVRLSDIQNQEAIKNYALTIAARPNRGPLVGDQIDQIFERHYKTTDLYLFITWLAQIHTGKITHGMVTGKANRMGLVDPKRRRKRLLTVKL